MSFVTTRREFGNRALAGIYALLCRKRGELAEIFYEPFVGQWVVVCRWARESQ